MDTVGLFAPEDTAAVRDRYAAVETAAAVAATEVANALDVDPDRVDDDIELVAQESIFASLLAVHVGTRAEFEEWVAGTDRETTLLGSEHVSRVAWHDAPVAGVVIGATFESEQAAAIGTLRRQAFARVYREVV